MKRNYNMKNNINKIVVIMIIIISTFCLFNITAFALNTSNDSFSSADNIQVGSSYSGELAQSSSIDYYKFTINESGKINVRVTTTMGYTYYRIYNSNTTEVWSSNSKNGLDKDVELVSGTYYFCVKKDDAYGTYNFKLDFTATGESFGESIDLQNNKIENSSEIFTDTSYIGQLAVNDTIDYYKFTLSESGKINVKVTTTMDYTYYKIYDSSNAEVWSSNTKGGLDRDVELVSGTYYFCVKKDDAYGKYSFKLDFSSANESFQESFDFKNNKIENASSVTTDKSYIGQLAVNDTIDYYIFTIMESGTVNVKVTTTMDYTYFKINDANNIEVWSSNSKSGVDKNVDLLAGTYYFYVKKDDAYGTYNFKLDYTVANESFKETTDSQNNKIDDASNISTNISYVGHLASNDTIDYYRFTLNQSGKLNVKVTTTMDYTYYKIYNSSNSEVWSSNSKSGVDKEVELNAGTYYFCVKKDDAYGVYNFALYPAHECLGSWQTTANPTCTTEGTQERKCTTCGKQIETAPIPSTGHTITTYSIYKEATCHAAGSRSGVCSVCGETIYEDVEILAHQYGELEVVSGSKLIPPIVKEKVCSLCGDVQSEKDWSFVWLPIVILIVSILSIFGVVNYIKAIKKR